MGQANASPDDLPGCSTARPLSPLLGRWFGDSRRPSAVVSGSLMSALEGPGAQMPSQHGDGWSARWNDHEGKRRRMTFRFKRDAEAYERKMKGEQEESPAPPVTKKAKRKA